MWDKIIEVAGGQYPVAIMIVGLAVTVFVLQRKTYQAHTESTRKANQAHIESLERRFTEQSAAVAAAHASATAALQEVIRVLQLERDALRTECNKLRKECNELRQNPGRPTAEE